MVILYRLNGNHFNVCHYLHNFLNNALIIKHDGKIMSSENKFSLAGKNLKEWAFIILMVNLSVVIGSYAVVFWIAVTNNPGAIAITGSIDISQIVIIVFGIAMVATVLVSQKLTKDAVSDAVAATDEVWSRNP